MRDFTQGTLPWLTIFFLAGSVFAATDVKVTFTLNTTDAYGDPIQQNRYYYLYRPDGLPKSTPVPMVLVMEDGPNSGPAGYFHRKADQAGLVLISCSFSGNSSGTPGSGWTADDPSIAGFEDIDYISEVIHRVQASDNANDAFITGLSKGGHISLAYACVRPSMLKAASSMDEFMGLTSNIPSAPLPVMLIHGTLDTNVPYTMTRDTVDAWRAMDSLLSVPPVTTYENAVLQPGMASQVTWRDPSTGLQVAFVTIIGGMHSIPTPAIQTGYDCTDGLWAFFSQFLTSNQDGVKIVAQPVSNVQLAEHAASFWVAATGTGTVGYQWQRNGVNIPGATANWYTTPPTTAGDSGAKFQVVVNNDAGSVTSPAAILTVKPSPADPAIVAQPQDQVVTAGEPVSFSINAASGSALTYQWLKNGDIITGATSPELDIPAAISSDCGANFTVVATSATGSVTSTQAMLTVSPAAGAPIILTNPARARVLQNQQATFSVNAWSTTPMTYQWQKGTFTGNMADVPGATAATYTTPLTTLADHLTLFRCVVSNAAGSVTSASELLFVTAARTAPTSLVSPIAAATQTGIPFQYTIQQSGGTAPITYSASGLPDPLTADPASGIISGIPSAAGISMVRIGASNSAGATSAFLTLTVADTPPVVTVEAWRMARFGASATDPTVAGDMADPDGDGYTNLDEFTFGSDPLDPASVPAALTAAPAAQDFGAVAVGSSAQAMFTVTNSGNADFNCTATVSGDAFAIVSGEFTVPPNGSAVVMVSFTPASAGTFTGQVVFSSNGGIATSVMMGSGM